MLEEANSEKAGRRLNRDKVGFLKGVSERMHEMMKALAEFVGWADYDDGMPDESMNGAKETKGAKNIRRRFTAENAW